MGDKVEFHTFDFVAGDKVERVEFDFVVPVQWALAVDYVTCLVSLTLFYLELRR